MYVQIVCTYMQAGLGGLGAYSQSPALGPAALHTPSPMSPLAVNPHLFAMEDERPTPTGSTPTAHALSPHAAGVFPSTRLYVVVSKAVSADILGSIFRTVPGLQFCDLKRDHRTGQSRARSQPAGMLIIPCPCLHHVMSCPDLIMSAGGKAIHVGASCTSACEHDTCL